ncbi:MAG TPA: Rieske (2Fe-2S) protein [Bryobacteraceae bacterium]|jgi:nitrite reductase/ring-hydroxylating ferredoxin subunit|nr:Rieske (2Fe-2S) protein [Bryobacteraceae bacterium]
MPWTKLAATAELPTDSVIEIEHDGALYAVCNAGGEFRTLSGVCPHSGGPLGQGTVLSGMVVCPWHMWEFNSATGACLVDKRRSIPVYSTKIEDGQIFADLPVNDPAENA